MFPLLTLVLSRSTLLTILVLNLISIGYYYHHPNQARAELDPKQQHPENINILENGTGEDLVAKITDLANKYRDVHAKETGDVHINNTYIQSKSGGKGPTITNNGAGLAVETVFKGIEFPTSMAFLGPNDILVLEKNEGTVKRIVNGVMLPQPLLDVNVATANTRGMLGIAVAKHENGKPPYVFLYYTEVKTKDSEDINKGKEPLGNRLYRYELINDKLVNPKLLLDLPATPGTDHNGGKIVIGPDNNVYLIIGDVEDHESQGYRTMTQNIVKGMEPDGRSGILRITQEGKAIKSIFGNTDPLNKYYAYGIRNSFGMDFDPVTGKLWDTETGPTFGDEINLVEPGFNSGWRKVQGIWKFNNNNKEVIGKIELNPNRLLVDFGGKGKYSSPEFIWYYPVGPTALTFLNSSKLGKQYENDMFVGDINNGYIYHFDLKEKNRTELALDNALLEDKIANNENETKSIIFGEGFADNEDGFRGISDTEVGNDGYIYVISFGQGTIYRIIPAR
jgi:aldose sugar dehydrogenase